MEGTIMKDNLVAWVAIVLQVITLAGGIPFYVISLSADIRTIKNEISGLNTEISGLKADIRDVRNDIKDVRNEIKDVRDEIKDVRNEIKDVRDELKEDIKTLNQNYIDHLAHHIGSPKP